MNPLIILVVIAFVLCCGIPLLRSLIDKTIHSLFGQSVQHTDLVYESTSDTLSLKVDYSETLL